MCHFFPLSYDSGKSYSDSSQISPKHTQEGSAARFTSTCPSRMDEQTKKIFIYLSLFKWNNQFPYKRTKNTERGWREERDSSQLWKQKFNLLDGLVINSQRCDLDAVSHVFNSDWCHFYVGYFDCSIVFGCLAKQTILSAHTCIQLKRAVSTLIQRGQLQKFWEIWIWSEEDVV